MDANIFVKYVWKAIHYDDVANGSSAFLECSTLFYNIRHMPQPLFGRGKLVLVLLKQEACFCKLLFPLYSYLCPSFVFEILILLYQFVFGL